MATTSLAGWRILVVEDETLIALLLEETLQELGCVVVGPVGKLDAALRLASDEVLNGAILDVTIRGGRVYPVAEILLGRDMPFVLASGYENWALPEALRDQPRLNKPSCPRISSSIYDCSVGASAERHGPHPASLAGMAASRTGSGFAEWPAAKPASRYL